MPGFPPNPRSAAHVAVERAWAALAAAVAGGGARHGRVRVSRDGGRTYPAGRERALTADLPNQPAAVRTYDDEGYARCLSADYDVSRGGQDQVDQDVARLRPDRALRRSGVLRPLPQRRRARLPAAGR